MIVFIGLTIVLSKLNDEEVSHMSINNLIASEFLIQAYTAEYVGIPIVFVAGDAGICNFINDNFPKIKTVTSKKCVGNSIISEQSEKINNLIKSSLKDSLNNELSQYRIDEKNRLIYSINDTAINIVSCKGHSND